jgi:hypothetical protein
MQRRLPSFLSKTLILALLSISLNAQAQNCDTLQLQFHQVWPSQTDGNIQNTLARHYAYYNPDCVPQNKLLLWIPGTFGNPLNYERFTSFAANHGFHVISLTYDNNVFASQFCANSTDPDCFENFRIEHLYGTDVDPNIDIDTSSCLLNRAYKLVQYLDAQEPTENWGQYLTNGSLDWSKIIPAGHSQGSGHAAYMGNQFSVERVLMFAGTNEYHLNFNDIADWVSDPKATPDSCYYGFGNTNDEIAQFSNQIWGWNTLGMGVFGDSISVDDNGCPYEHHRNLYTSRFFTGTGLSVNHSSVVEDSNTPVDVNGLPEFGDVWRYMLGVCVDPNGVGENLSEIGLSVYPNPSEGKFTVEFEQLPNDTKIAVYDILGKELYSTTANSMLHTIDLGTCSPGVYVLKVMVGRQVSTRRVTIQ